MIGHAPRDLSNPKELHMSHYLKIAAIAIVAVAVAKRVPVLNTLV